MAEMMSIGLSVERPLVDDVVEPATDERGDRHDDHPAGEDVRVLTGLSRRGL
jgi:hypothetical protein